MFKVKNLFWFIPLLALVTFPLWQPHVNDFLRPTAPTESPRVAVGPDKSMTIAGLTFFLFNKDRREWRIKASTMYSDDGEKDLRLENVEADFFGEKAKGEESAPTANIRSDKARYEKERQLLTLRDNVVVTTTSGYEMRTDVLYYREDLHQLHATAGVTIVGQGLLLTGREMTYDPERQYLQVDGQVTAEIY